MPFAAQIWKSYYFAGSQMIALRVQGDPLAANNGVFFLHADHLGSASLTTDASGTLVARQLYDAWGNIRASASSGTMPTDIGYTGQRLDNSTGLMYYRARYYASSLGRFASADTIVPQPGNPQTWNRYSYVYNRPLNFIDPTGHCAVEGESDTCGQFRDKYSDFRSYLQGFNALYGINTRSTHPGLWSTSDLNTVYQTIEEFPKGTAGVGTLILGGRVEKGIMAGYNHPNQTLTLYKAYKDSMSLMMRSLGVDADTVFKINIAHELIHAAQRNELTEDDIRNATTYEDKWRKTGASIDWNKALGFGKSVEGFTDLFNQYPNYAGMFPKRPNGELLIQLEPVPFIEGMAIAGSMNMYAPWNISPELQTWAQSAGYVFP